MADRNQLEDWHRQALLTQYQTLQHDSSAMISAHWTVVGIFLGINSALIGLSSYILTNDAVDKSGLAVIFALAVASIAIIGCLWRWLDRVNNLVEVNERIMSEIEIYIPLRVRAKPQGDGSWPIKAIYIILAILWLAAICGAIALLRC